MKSYPQALRDAFVGMARCWEQIPSRTVACWEPMKDLAQAIGALALVIITPLMLPLAFFVAFMIQADERKVERERKEWLERVNNHYGSRRQQEPDEERA